MKSSSVASLMFLALLGVGVAAHTQAPSHSEPDRRWSATDRSVATPARTSIAREQDTRVPFDALDTEGRGYITSGDARKDDWTRRNFARCNLSHDGHLSEVEYSNCPE
jgi:hypothetical protein